MTCKMLCPNTLKILFECVSRAALLAQPPGLQHFAEQYLAELNVFCKDREGENPKILVFLFQEMWEKRLLPLNSTRIAALDEDSAPQTMAGITEALKRLSPQLPLVFEQYQKSPQTTTEKVSTDVNESLSLTFTPGPPVGDKKVKRGTQSVIPRGRVKGQTTDSTTVKVRRVSSVRVGSRPDPKAAVGIPKLAATQPLVGDETNGFTEAEVKKEKVVRQIGKTTTMKSSKPALTKPPLTPIKTKKPWAVLRPEEKQRVLWSEREAVKPVLKVGDRNDVVKIPPWSGTVNGGFNAPKLAT
ncbi:uncharacterized protein LOC128759158 isoform X2 [Synchiropus splendidus]|uniref:uncharacterized protein LOC128759158 isoform X2 n=1 Tax=Synchiropus splendidus TaxID=270530 RepID=UPI00237E7936|nr:uncharacterized protein LOC128759158 isoform X2 [Synchiropus splendidus]